MDGWETRRRRTPGYDWCIVKLGLPGIVHGVIVDTAHFKGNYPEQCEMECCAADGDPGAQQFTDAAMPWRTLLPKSPLAGDTQNRFAVSCLSRVTHLRFKIYPDGGVARLRVHGEALPDWPAIERAGGEIDLAAVEHGGLIIDSSDMFFGSRNNLILPGRSTECMTAGRRADAAAQAMTGASCGWARPARFAAWKSIRRISKEISRKAVLLKFATQDATFPIRARSRPFHGKKFCRTRS